MRNSTRLNASVQHSGAAMRRRHLLLGAAAAPWMLAGAGAQTSPDGFPNRPLRLIVGFTPGSVGDIFARALAQLWGTQLGQPIVIDNKPGGSQIIAAELAARAAPDGYTLYLGTQGAMVLNTIVRKKLSYDPLKDFTPISMLFNTPMYLYVSPAVAKSTAELIAVAKAKPGKLTFGSIGPVTAAHVLGEMFKSEAGVDMLHVPFKGGPEITNALVSGQIDVYFNAGNLSMVQVRAGKVRVLASVGAKRTEETPDLPSLAEQGLPGVDLLPWFGLFGPAGMPRPLVERLNREVVAILKSPAMKERAGQMGAEVQPSTPEALIAQVKAEIPRLAQVMQKAGVTPE